MLRFFLHYGIHFVAPMLIALFLFKDNRLRVLLLLWAGIVIDIDHFLADPFFDPDRCSIGFHPLHSSWAIGIYTGLLIIREVRLIGIALLLHILADTVDCLFLW